MNWKVWLTNVKINPSNLKTAPWHLMSSQLTTMAATLPSAANLQLILISSPDNQGTLQEVARLSVSTLWMTCSSGRIQLNQIFPNFTSMTSFRPQLARKRPPRSTLNAHPAKFRKSLKSKKEHFCPVISFCWKSPLKAMALALLWLAKTKIFMIWGNWWLLLSHIFRCHLYPKKQRK